ncbi:hypothetical protein OK016_07000 [Vibrio chagasii]|nr:hypothetical protein [Vibrio chagasii]
MKVLLMHPSTLWSILCGWNSSQGDVTPIDEDGRIDLGFNGYSAKRPLTLEQHQMVSWISEGSGEWRIFKHGIQTLGCLLMS